MRIGCLLWSCEILRKRDRNKIYSAYTRIYTPERIFICARQVAVLERVIQRMSIDGQLISGCDKMSSSIKWMKMFVINDAMRIRNEKRMHTRIYELNIYRLFCFWVLRAPTKETICSFNHGMIWHRVLTFIIAGRGNRITFTTTEAEKTHAASEKKLSFNKNVQMHSLSSFAVYTYLSFMDVVHVNHQGQW